MTRDPESTAHLATNGLGGVFRAVESADYPIRERDPAQGREDRGYEVSPDGRYSRHRETHNHHHDIRKQEKREQLQRLTADGIPEQPSMQRNRAIR